MCVRVCERETDRQTDRQRQERILVLLNTLTAFLQSGKFPPTNVLYMTLNNLMVRIQECWRYRECGVLSSFPGSLRPRVIAPDRVLPIFKV